MALSRTLPLRAVSSHRKGGAAVRTAHHLYSVYGLTLASDVELPELTESRGEPEVSVFAAPRLERASAEPRARAFDGGGLDVVLDYPRLARLEIRGGREIAVAAAAGADPAAVRALVLGPALGVLLHQRGVLALHASSVLLDRGVVAFLGRSGAGKSTMAAALHRRGHALVADDITAVEAAADEIGVLPAFPRLKLFPEAAAAVGLDPDTLPRVSAVDDKLARRVASHLPARRLRLAALYVLADGDTASIVPIARGDALLELVRHSFCAPRLAELGSREHFLQCSDIVRRVPVRRLGRPTDLALLDEVAALVERDGRLAP